MNTPIRSLGITIEYIQHSGFKVETDQSLLVFDYYQGPIQLPDNKKTYVFSSHSHPDHFNPVILEWQKDHPNIHYIFSSDIKGDSHIPPKGENVTFLSPYEKTHIDDLNIKAYGSTDIGISFLLELVDQRGTQVFHAGDLNWWHWWGEPQADIQRAEAMFKEEIAKIKGESIDIAFFPVDPRLEQYYSLGAEYFIQEVKPQILLPMHFWDDFNTTKNFAKKMAGTPTRIFEINHSNQKFTL
ncbi:MAG: MBL fold metallo-hydrolase [Desulfitobacterium sp.]